MKHPYIPNADESVRRGMMDAIGMESLNELYRDVPEELRLKAPLDLPPRMASEYALERHVTGILERNRPAGRRLSFLGAGCYQHHVPAVCDEIAGRAEFRSAYAGEPYDDHGRFQALFEYQSLMAELLDCEVVNVPAMDGAQAAATAVRMAQRLTGRSRALLFGDSHPDVLRVIRNYCAPGMEIKSLPIGADGRVPLSALKAALRGAAAVYVEAPSFLGLIPEDLPEIAALAHAAGAFMIAGCRPALLGVLESPMNLGADLVTGDVQGLGVHMNYGGGQAGFIGSRDEARIVEEYPSRLFGITRTVREGEYGFGDVAYERTSFADREHAREYVGTQAALNGITAGVYLALMGPDGMRALGVRMLTSARYLAGRLSEIPGVRIPFPGFACEFVADFSGTGRTVKSLSEALAAKDVFLGCDLTGDFPSLGQAALISVTEVHEKADLDRFADGIAQEVRA